MKIIGVIPARLAATRLPNKPLINISGKPMIWHVWNQASASQLLSEVIIATPDDAILEAVETFGGRAMMTSIDHRSGTDRVAEVASKTDGDIYVNIQGDEPLITPNYIDRAVQPFLDESGINMTSLFCPCPTSEIDNPATVKVVCDSLGNALYFSRYPLPYNRNNIEGLEIKQHIGLYAYTRTFVLNFAGLAPGSLEKIESLEQLRVLEAGYNIRMVGVENAPLSVDTPEDLQRVARLFETR